MKLQVRLLEIESGGKPIVVMDDETAGMLGVHSLDRVEVSYEKAKATAIVNIASNFSKKILGIYDEVRFKLKVRNWETVEVNPAKRPRSLSFIRRKLMGDRLTPSQIRAIVVDLVQHRLSDVELASFVTALHIRGISMDENEALSRAMIETGETLKLSEGPVYDKHSIGGVPGDKTTLVVVPIVAAAGYTIPKTSSRAITCPAGTADRVEVLCPVDISLDQIIEVVNKTGGCMVWGGALNLAPADDLFIKVEYPLAIDPLLLPSIISKKKAMGSNHVVIDIPTGRGAKIKTIGEAHTLASDFIQLGKRLGMNIECAVTFGEQPIGYAIGPALEAREALQSLSGNGPIDLREKAINLSGILFELAGINNGKQKAMQLLESGEAGKKFRQIISAQGGNSEITPEDIKVGDKIAKIVSDQKGEVLWIHNNAITQIAREAGAPKNKGAGLLLKVKLGDKVAKGDTLFEVYAESNWEMENAVALANDLAPIGLSKLGKEMLIDRIPAKVPHERPFILER